MPGRFALTLYIPRDPELKAKEDRAREILHRLKGCHKATASPRAINPALPPSHCGYTAGAGEPRLRQDWMADVTAALQRGAGRTGGQVLALRLTRQQNSQACSFLSIAIKLGWSEADVRFVYHAALHGFLAWMDRHQIPDDYRPEAEMPEVRVRRRAAA